MKKLCFFLSDFDILIHGRKVSNCVYNFVTLLSQHNRIEIDRSKFFTRVTFFQANKQILPSVTDLFLLCMEFTVVCGGYARGGPVANMNTRAVRVSVYFITQFHQLRLERICCFDRFIPLPRPIRFVDLPEPVRQT